MKQIKLTNGKYTLVDDEDYNNLLFFIWRESDRGYVVRTEHTDKNLPSIVKMHRQILGFPEGETDHINRDRLDNRRENLRTVSRAQNQYNSQKRLAGYGIATISRFKGVKFLKDRPKQWQARIKVNRKEIHLGTFKTEVEAAKAYDEAILRIVGELVTTNKSLGLFDEDTLNQGGQQ